MFISSLLRVEVHQIASAKKTGTLQADLQRVRFACRTLRRNLAPEVGACSQHNQPHAAECVTRHRQDGPFERERRSPAGDVFPNRMRMRRAPSASRRATFRERSAARAANPASSINPVTNACMGRPKKSPPRPGRANTKVIWPSSAKMKPRVYNYVLCFLH